MPRLDVDDAFTLSPLARKIKKRASRNKWQTIVTRAHKRGVTVSAFVDETIPMALKERTRAGLTKQATDTINTAYKPVELEITQAEKRTQAVDDKRKRDNLYYQEWLRKRGDEMAIHSRAAEQRLLDTQREIVDQANADTAGLRQEIQQSVAGMAGVISDPNQATAADVTPEATRNAQLLAAERQATSDVVGSGERQRQANDASNFAMIAASEAKRVSDTWTRLSELGDERQKVQLAKAADTAKEVSRLLDLEVDKAAQNREFGVVAQELGLKQASQALDVIEEANQQGNADAQFKAQYGISMDRYVSMTPEQRLRWRAKWAKAGKAAPKKVGKTSFHDGYTYEEWKAMSPAQRRRAHKAWGDAGREAGDGVTGDGGVKRQGRFEKAYGLIGSSSTPGTPGSGNEPGKPGKPYSKQYVKQHRQRVINQLVAEGYNRVVAEAAVNAFVSLGGKSPGDWKRWRNKLGIDPNAPAYPTPEG